MSLFLNNTNSINEQNYTGLFGAPNQNPTNLFANINQGPMNNQNNLFNNNNLINNNNNTLFGASSTNLFNFSNQNNNIKNNNINNNNRLLQSINFNFNGRNVIEKNGASNFLSISSIDEFYELSFEELRLNDYSFFKTGNIPPQPVFNRNNTINKYINNNLNQNQNSFLEIIIIIQIYFLLILIIILSFYLIIIIIYQEMACFLITIVEIMEIILCLEIIVIIL